MEIDLPLRSNLSENNTLKFPFHCHASCQTSLGLIGSSTVTFEKFSLNFDELKESEGYVCTESLNVNHYCNSGCTDMIKQLLIRDKVINIYRKYLEDLLNQGKSLEKDITILKYKDEGFTEEIKRLKKLERKKEKLMKTKKKRMKAVCNKLKQTLKSTCNAFTQTDTEFACESDWYLEQQKLNEHCKKETERPNEKGFYDVEQRFNSSKINEISSAVNKVDKHLKDSGRESTGTPTIDTTTSVNSINTDMEFLCKEESLCENENKERIDDVGWDSSNVKEEVEAVAEEITNQLGYVFIDEIGMYYDHSSGYYYDDKTSLFYDGNTGTYFYYNHQTNNYEFYSQVDPTPNMVAGIPAEIKNKKRKVPKEEDLDKEEGECSDSEEDEENEETDDIALNEADSLLSSEVDLWERNSAEVAPSLRLMVMNGAFKGNLHVVTLNGGTIGREGDVQVLLKSPSVSKLHAEICYESDGPSDHHYFIRDLASNNGTLVRGKRISESKLPSELIEVGHGWEIQCGDVILSCHIHPGLLTCNECEPGLVEGNERGNLKTSAFCRFSKHKLEKERRRQNKVIRKKFSLNWFEQQPQTNPLYKDRSVKRREVVGSDNPYEKTQVASIETNLTKDNKGFQLLQKMGWSEGQSLGTNDTGITEPIIPSVCSGRTGLGGVSLPSLPEKTCPSKNSLYREMADVTKEKHEETDLLHEVRFTAASHNSNGS